MTPAAAQISARQSSNEDVGEFGMVVTPRPNHTLTELETAADAIIERLKAEGPTPEELQKATASEELAFLNGMQSNLGKAGRLSEGSGYYGDPAQYKKEYEATLELVREGMVEMRQQEAFAPLYLRNRQHAAKPAEAIS